MLVYENIHTAAESVHNTVTKLKEEVCRDAPQIKSTVICRMSGFVSGMNAGVSQEPDQMQALVALESVINRSLHDSEVAEMELAIAAVEGLWLCLL